MSQSIISSDQNGLHPSESLDKGVTKAPEVSQVIGHHPQSDGKAPLLKKSVSHVMEHRDWAFAHLETSFLEKFCLIISQWHGLLRQ